MRKEEKLEITKEKLVTAATELLATCGDPNEVTSRAIVTRAGVPLGMVNYCFGSREALLFEAFCRNRDRYLTDDRMVEIMTADISAKEKVRRLHYLVSDFLVNEYKYTHAITGYLLLNRDLTKGLTTLPLIREHYGDKKEEWELRLISYQLSSLMQLIIYRIDDMSSFLDMDLHAGEELHRLIDAQIDLLLEDVV